MELTRKELPKVSYINFCDECHVFFNKPCFDLINFYAREYKSNTFMYCVCMYVCIYI